MNNIMLRLQLIVLVGLTACLGTSRAAAEPKEVKPLQQWKGNLADRALMKWEASPITSKDQFEKLWKAWRANEKVPAVDFAKEIVFVGTTVGSLMTFRATLDETGNLRVGGAATADDRPGFRYDIIILSREGVKTVDGKELPPPSPQK